MHHPEQPAPTPLQLISVLSAMTYLRVNPFHLRLLGAYPSTACLPFCPSCLDHKLNLRGKALGLRTCDQKNKRWKFGSVLICIRHGSSPCVLSLGHFSSSNHPTSPPHPTYPRHDNMWPDSPSPNPKGHPSNTTKLGGPRAVPATTPICCPLSSPLLQLVCTHWAVFSLP